MYVEDSWRSRVCCADRDLTAVGDGRTIRGDGRVAGVNE